MNDAKHTPGPWQLETVRTQVGVCHKVGKLGSSTKLNYACLYDDCYSAEPRDLQLLADARLIAAAPDLLEACKAALFRDPAEWNILSDSQRDEREKEIGEKLEAAIAKAERK